MNLIRGRASGNFVELIQQNMKTTVNYFSRVLCLLLLCIGLAVSGCYDDSALKTQLSDHEQRLDSLELICARLNTNCEALETVMAALDANDYVTAVAPVLEENRIIGYTITFKQSGCITIYNGVTPLLKVEYGDWYASFDYGETWQNIGKADASGDNFITDVKLDDQYLVLTLSDGQTLIKLPVARQSPVMDIEMGHRHIRFSGKIDPSLLSVDTKVGVFNCWDDNTNIWDARGEYWTYEFSKDGSYEIICMVTEESFSGCEFVYADGETIYYRTALYSSSECIYSDLLSVVWKQNDAVVTAEVLDLTETSVMLKGSVSFKYAEKDTIILTFYEADDTGETLDWNSGVEIPVTLNEDNSFTVSVSDLKTDAKYFCQWRVEFFYLGDWCDSSDTTSGDLLVFTTPGAING